MAFDKLEVQSVKHYTRSPAAITLSRHTKSSKPATVTISLRSDYVAEAGFSPKSTFDALIGTGEDAGKLRLVEAKDGKLCACFMKRTNAFFVRLGVIKAIGIDPCPRTPADARVITKGTIEIDIPELSPVADDEDADDAAGEQKAAAPVAAKPPSSHEVFLNGISVDLTDGEESVTFDGEGIVVSSIEAKLVTLLARPRPAPVAEAFIVANLWSKGGAPKNANEQLRQLCAGDLKAGLAKLGLNLAPVKGVGYQLKDA